MGFAALLNFGMVAYFGVRLTHRIAGPMYSLVRQFRLMRDGNLVAKFNVRQQDELKFVVRNFNEMVDSLTTQTRRDLGRIEKIVAALSESGASPALIEAEALRADLQARIQGATVS
jgi:nitrogen fixation/metabolism regulation signal transduction histidine kinase